MDDERFLIPTPYCYEPILYWEQTPLGLRSVMRPCKQRVYRQGRCFDHSPNAKRPKPAGR